MPVDDLVGAAHAGQVVDLVPAQQQLDERRERGALLGGDGQADGRRGGGGPRRSRRRLSAGGMRRSMPRARAAAARRGGYSRGRVVQVRLRRRRTPRALRGSRRRAAPISGFMTQVDAAAVLVLLERREQVRLVLAREIRPLRRGRRRLRARGTRRRSPPSRGRPRSARPRRCVRPDLGLALEALRNTRRRPRCPGPSATTLAPASSRGRACRGGSPAARSRGSRRSGRRASARDTPDAR